jgi:hypothetical protein
MGDLSGQLYPGARQLRTVIVRPDYVLDFFQIKTEGERPLAWIVHVDGKPQYNSGGELKLAPLPAGRGWSYLRNARSAGWLESYGEIFTHSRHSFHLSAWCSAPAEMIFCDFPLADGMNPPVVPMRLWRLRGTAAWFLAVYRIGEGPLGKLDAAVRPAELGTWKIALSMAKQRVEHTVPAL